MKKSLVIIGLLVGSIFSVNAQGCCGGSKEKSSCGMEGNKTAMVTHHEQASNGDVQDGIKAVFIVAGNCGMCKSRIEKAANKVEGVISSDWNKANKNMTLYFDAKKTSLEKIKKQISIAGHDIEGFVAADKVYQKLPGCCQYDRI